MGSGCWSMYKMNRYRLRAGPAEVGEESLLPWGGVAGGRGHGEQRNSSKLDGGQVGIREEEAHRLANGEQKFAE